MTAVHSSAGSAAGGSAARGATQRPWFMPLVSALWGTAPGQRAVATVDMLAAAAARGAAPRPRVRIRSDGWVLHNGGPFPFDPDTTIMVRHAHEDVSFAREPMPAAYWPENWWHGLAASWRNNIAGYRIIGGAGA